MKKAYEAPAMKVHGSVEDLTQFTGGSSTEMVFGAIDTGIGCHTNVQIGGVVGCYDLGS